MKITEEDWLIFIQKRLNELHPLIWSEKEPLSINTYPYFIYNKQLYDRFNKGTDYSNNPRNPLKNRKTF